VRALGVDVRDAVDVAPVPWSYEASQSANGRETRTRGILGLAFFAYLFKR